MIFFLNDDITKDEGLKNISYDKLYRRAYRKKLEQLNDAIELLEELKKK